MRSSLPAFLVFLAFLPPASRAGDPPPRLPLPQPPPTASPQAGAQGTTPGIAATTPPATTTQPPTTGQPGQAPGQKSSAGSGEAVAPRTGAAPAKVEKAPEKDRPSRKPIEPHLFPGGVLDLSGRTAYLAGADGAIEALDLLTGDLLWTTHEAQVPILVVGNHLIAQAGVKRNRLRLLSLDLQRKGEVVQETNPVIFPRWVVTGDAPGHTFETHWRLEGAQVVLNWSASAWAEGQEMATLREPSTRKQASGTSRIDLETGEVENGPAEKTPPSPSGTPPRQLQRQSVRWTRVLDRHLLALVLIEQERPNRKKKEEAVNGFRTTESGGSVPWGPTGNAPPGPGTPPGVSGTRTPSRKYELQLRAWDWLTGKQIEPRTVFVGRQPTVLPSLDNELLFLRDASPAPDEMTESKQEEAQAWKMYAVRQLQEVGSVPYVPGTHSIQQVGNRIYYLVAGPITGPLMAGTNVRPQTLQAYEPATKKVVWERPVAGRALHPPGQ